MGESDSKCTVELTDDYIDVVWHGHITKEMAAVCVDEVLAATNKMIQAKQAVLLRIKIENPPALPNTDAFSEGMNILRLDVPFQRIVIWGKLAAPVRVLVNVLLGSFQHLYAMRYIEDEKEALSWLLKGDARTN